MKNKILLRIIYPIIALVQLSIIIGVFIIQYLTDKKAGVMHHVYYRRYQYENSLFSQENLVIQKWIAILIILVFIIMLIYSLKKQKTMFYKLQNLIALVISALVYIVISSQYFISKLAYHYFIISFFIVLAIQIVVLITTVIQDSRIRKIKNK